MAPNVQREIERKYEVPPGAEPDWSALPTLTTEPEVDSRALEAVYYDTGSDRLAGFGIALRRRRGGPDAGWHLKYRDELGKHELHVPLLKTSDRLPAQMKQYVAGLLAGQELAPLATVRTDRRVLNVMHPDLGHVAEICIDDVTTVAERTGVRRSWAEYEVELVNDSGADGARVFEELEQVLLAGGLTPSESAAKIARALGADDDAPAVTVVEPDGTVREAASPDEPVAEPGAEGEQPGEKKSGKKTGKKTSKKSGKKSAKQKASGKKHKKKSAKKSGEKSSEEPAEESAGKASAKTLAKDPEKAPDRGSEDEAVPHPAEQSTEDRIRSLISASADALAYADFRLRIGDPEGVHEVRVSARRLIALIQGVGQEVAGTDHLELSERLWALSGQLSAARDAEVVAELLPLRAAVVGEQVSNAGLGQLRTLAQGNRESTRSAAVRYLNGKAHLQLLADLNSWKDELRLADAARALSGKKVATRAVKRWHETLSDADAQLGVEDTATIADTTPLRVLDSVHLHRKALRNLRYGMEGLAGVPGLEPKKSWRHLLDGTEEIQGELSDIMDSAVMDAWFASAARSLIRTGGDRYVVGLLHGHERARIQDYERRAPEVIDRLLSEVTPDV
ncbi:CYTH and CHAD domain-containing protein [Kocuria coralli]|uniref:CYTH and CHAD domain-containing protein n=1 Tax=Kocuria coralli TaxID=1461025 RepID=A0A5J5KVC1_9MICC|nr:CYTH and CHAD domain-containing protein [Kocuria coralli]KAA9393657.1 CYTH and CHAD domain-containing protein [Kocuria coralli]